MHIALLVIGLILFVLLVVVHEFGHFIAARRNGVEVEEFAIFFPPTLYQRKTKAGWIFKINLLPLGGYVKLKGEHDTDTEKGSFGAASLWVKTKIMAGGVLMNLGTGLVMLTILAIVGMPQLFPNQFNVKSDSKLSDRRILISYVEPGSPAEKAGLKVQDQLMDIKMPGYSPVAVSDSEQLPSLTKSFAGKKATVYYIRQGEERQTTLTFRSEKEVAASRKTDNPKGYLGVSPTELEVRKSTWSAPVVALGLTAQVTELTFEGLGHALGGLGSIVAGTVTHNTQARQHGQDSASQVSGPVGIFAILQVSSGLGFQFIWFIIGYISLALALMNILPIPALDGGRLWITLIARAVKRPLSAKREELINAVGFMVLLTLIVVISIVDVRRFF